MGHYTDFTLRMECEIKDDKLKILEWVDEQTAGVDNYDLIEIVKTGSLGYRKWYECKDDMIEFSTRFPRVLFILDCDSREGFGSWRYYFKDGHCHYVEPEYPEFDESMFE